MWQAAALRCVAALVALSAVTAEAQTSATVEAAGAMATIVDSATGATEVSVLSMAMPRPGSGSATFFVLKRANGEDLRTGIDASVAASRGLGRNLRIVLPEHQVKAGKATLRLLATVAHAAPIESIFARGGGAAEGEVEVDLKPGTRYRVTGVLDEFRREVWLEEEATGRVLGKKIVQSPNPEATAAMATADRYTCCNLRYDGDSISGSNFIGQPFVPAGSRVKVTGWGRNRVNVYIEGRKMTAGPDEDYEPMTREQFADRIFVKEDPKAKLESYLPQVQQAIASGRVVAGMTREQVVMAIGFPRGNRTAGGLASNRYVYSLSENEEFDLDFDAEGKLVAVNANSRVKRAIVLAP